MRIHDMFHKITTDLVNYLVENDIDTFIMGHNVGQKQNINLGKKTNQNFVLIPFGKLRNMLTYKCARAGIWPLLTLTFRASTHRFSQALSGI